MIAFYDIDDYSGSPTTTGTSGSATTTYYWANTTNYEFRLPPLRLPPKNWRWFHSLARGVLERVVVLPIVLQEVRRMVIGPSAVERRRLKRRAFIHALKSC